MSKPYFGSRADSVQGSLDTLETDIAASEAKVDIIDTTCDSILAIVDV